MKLHKNKNSDNLHWKVKLILNGYGRLLLILQTSGKTSEDKWETSADEWWRMRDQFRWVMTNERLVRDECRWVNMNEKPNQCKQVQTHETQVRTLVHLQDDFICLRAFTMLNLLTDLIFKTASLFPCSVHFGPYSW